MKWAIKYFPLRDEETSTSVSFCGWVASFARACACTYVCVCVWFWLWLWSLLGKLATLESSPTVFHQTFSGPKIVWQAQNQNWKLKNMWIKWPLHCWPAKKIPDSSRNTRNTTPWNDSGIKWRQDFYKWKEHLLWIHLKHRLKLCDHLMLLPLLSSSSLAIS